MTPETFIASLPLRAPGVQALREAAAGKDLAGTIEAADELYGAYTEVRLAIERAKREPDAVAAEVARANAEAERRRLAAEKAPVAPKPAETPASATPTPPKPKRPGKVATIDGYTEPTSEFTKVPSRILKAILDVAPAPVLRAYLYCLDIADRRTGRFFVSYGKLSLRIGAPKDRRQGMRAMRRLQAAGLVRLVERGGTDHLANAYQLVSPDLVDTVSLRELTKPALRPADEQGE